MKIKSVLLIMLSLCLVIGLCACGGSESGDNNTTTTTNGGTSTAATTTTTTIATTTTTTLAEGKANYTVTVIDENGNPVPGACVQMCLNMCIAHTTNSQGVASYPNMDEADYKVSFVTVPAGYEMPTDNFYFEAGSTEMTIVLKAA